MSAYYISDNEFRSFVTKLISSKKVIGPVAKRKKFVFARLENVDELRLDYDVTILPPKKEFFPPNQDIVKFNGDNYSSCACPEEKILFGVHFYDIKAIDMTDLLFNERFTDNNYLGNRRATTIVGSSVQSISERAFFGSVGAEVAPRGHDAFMTKIKGGYVFDTRTDKGEALIACGKFSPASVDQLKEAKAANDKANSSCPEKLNHGTKDIAKKVRESFEKDEMWEKMAHDCFSCGSCNVICPTCYCFDVQDNWNLDQKTGQRTRSWDGCLTEDFAKTSLGGGHQENFREEKGSRFRHRIMRKATYLNPKLGGPACVGCGRCSQACTADIADPVRVINSIMES